MSRSIAFCLPLLLALAACGPAEPPPLTPFGLTYKCDGHPDLSIQFAADRSEVNVRLENGDIVTLVRQPVHNGFAYANGAYAIRGLGNKLDWMIGRRAPIKCEKA